MQEWQRSVAVALSRILTADTYITCRVTSQTKARVRALAQREGIKESTLVKQLLDMVLRTSTYEAVPEPLASERMNGAVRLNVRLELDIGRLLKERARGRGMASATYLSSLARAHLLGAAPLPKAEYLALKQAIEQLAAIGRNLNQIARVMNEGGKPTPPGLEEVMAMLKVSEALRDHIRALLNANSRSWESGHAERSH